MGHLVKCPVCQQTFDRDKIQAVRYNGRRYAHQTCFPQGELIPLSIKEVKEVDEDLTKLFEYIKQLLGEKYNYAKVKKQIKDFKEEYGYSYSGMLKSLIYFYEVKGNSKDKANGGVGIIPFIYKDAFQYYLNLFMANNANINKDVIAYTSQVREIVIKPPQAYIPKRLFNLDEKE